jgi:hypothetical protein
MNVFNDLDALGFIKSGEVTIEDSDETWVRLNIENVEESMLEHYLNQILQHIRKVTVLRIRVLLGSTNVVFNLPICA